MGDRLNAFLRLITPERRQFIKTVGAALSGAMICSARAAGRTKITVVSAKF